MSTRWYRRRTLSSKAVVREECRERYRAGLQPGVPAHREVSQGMVSGCTALAHLTTQAERIVNRGPPPVPVHSKGWECG